MIKHIFFDGLLLLSRNLEEFDGLCSFLFYLANYQLQLIYNFTYVYGRDEALVRWQAKTRKRRNRIESSK